MRKHYSQELSVMSYPRESPGLHLIVRALALENESNTLVKSIADCVAHVGEEEHERAARGEQRLCQECDISGCVAMLAVCKWCVHEGDTNAMRRGALTAG